MVDTNSGDLLARLKQLSKREREVLELRCQGMKYVAIGKALSIAESTVKTDMGRIYMKMGLDVLDPSVRLKALYDTVCPLLKLTKPPSETTKALPPNVVDGEVLPEDDKPIPGKVKDMVEEDGKALVPWTPAPLVSPPPLSRRPIWPVVLVVGVVLGICLGAGGLYLILRSPNGLNAIIPQPTPTSPTPTAMPSETPLPSPTPEVPTQTAIVVVVTATPLPATEVPTLLPTAAMSLPFEDTFDLRARPEWEIITGTWRVLDGHFTADTNSERHIALVGDKDWRNYKIEVTTFSKDYVDPIRIIARASDAGYIAFEYYTGGTRWLVVQNGKEQKITESNGYFSWDQSYKIAMEVKEDIYTVFVNGLQYSQIQDSTFSRGRVGIGFMSNYLTWFDDFRVTALP